MGYAQAGVNAGKIANINGAFGGSGSTAGAALGGAAGMLGMVNGLKQGGVQGYGGATVGALQTASAAESLMGNAAMSSTLGAAAGYVAAPLAVYSAVANWKSGDTGGDALRGAEAGAAIGSIVPGIGTLIGGVIGGAVGAISSAFGGGKVDPENTTFENYTKAYASNPQSVANASPPQTYQALAGLFDLRSNQIKGNIPMYEKYGRMGEDKFTGDMTSQINSAISSGKVSKNATPAQLYQQVVTPWMNSWGKGQMKDSNAGAIQGMVTQLIGQWQNGQFTSKTKMGIGGNTINIPQYGA